MIPWGLIIVGVIATLFGVIGILSLVIWLPIKATFKTVYDSDIEFIRARSDLKMHRIVEHNTRKLRNLYLICCIMGPSMFFAGIYLGYAAEGEGFWFYKKFYPEAIEIQVWDDINEEGQFVSADGKEYTYYILVSGKDISLSGEKCVDVAELENRLSKIRRENTVILIDSFAVSSVYHSVEAVLNELGIEYEETK